MLFDTHQSSASGLEISGGPSGEKSFQFLTSRLYGFFQPCFFSLSP